jgi:hypothetical protein
MIFFVVPVIMKICCKAAFIKTGTNYANFLKSCWRECILGCFRKCHFGIPRNMEFYTELVLFRVIPRNFFTVQFHGISRNFAEFRGIPCRFVNTEFLIPSNENTIIENF